MKLQMTALFVLCSMAAPLGAVEPDTQHDPDDEPLEGLRTGVVRSVGPHAAHFYGATVAFRQGRLTTAGVEEMEDGPDRFLVVVPIDDIVGTKLVNVPAPVTAGAT